MAKDIQVPYSYTKNGIYYFERRVPRDLRRHYSVPKIAYSLRTRSASVAASRATRAAQQLDEYWYHMRIKDFELPGKHLLRLQQSGLGPAAYSNGLAVPDTPSVKLSEAVAIYLRLKGQNRPATFHCAAERSCGYVIDTCGDKDLLSYAKADATRFRDALIERGLAGSSITRIFGTVRSVMNFAASEVGITITNPFAGIYYDRRMGVKDRSPLPIDDLRLVQQECMKIDDEMRWLVALVSDTGMRLFAVYSASTNNWARPEVRRLSSRSGCRPNPLEASSMWGTP